MKTSPGINFSIIIATLCAASIFVFAGQPQPSAAPNGKGKATNLGDPLYGLTPSQLALFVEGSNSFVKLDTPLGDGLGPIFNSPNCATNESCATCHKMPVSGGLLNFAETRTGVLTNYVFYPFTELGGSLIQNCAIPCSVVETNPAYGLLGAVLANRIIIPLFGDGLIEAIPDDVIIKNGEKSRGNGVHGRPAMVTDIGSTNASGQNPVRVGRFGWKAQQASLRAFSGDAYRNEMGVTNPLFPYETQPNGPDALKVPCDDFPIGHPQDLDDAPDANGVADIDRFANFMRLLAPPPPLPLDSSALRGQVIFKQIGCAQCHTPTLMTGPSPIKALANEQVNLYSDLLLHDMGTLNDNIEQGDAKFYEMRTPPLWGVRFRLNVLTHNGQAVGIPMAIGRHDGEGARANSLFQALPPADQANLVHFVESL